MSSFGSTSEHRVHVNRPEDWGQGSGSDFHAHFDDAEMFNPANRHQLSAYGWTTTALAILTATGSGASFLDSSDEADNAGVGLQASGDLLQSPRSFGTHGSAHLAKESLGYFPTKMRFEIYARFSVAGSDEQTTGFGWIEDAGSPAVANDHLAFICRDSSVFTLRSGADSDGGAAIDTDWHLFCIDITAAGVEWFIDGVSQGTIALEANEFPVSFGAHSFTNNQLMIDWLHVSYL